MAFNAEAIAHVETRIAEVACVYPITPSTTMAALFQAAVAAGATNLWGTPLRFIEPESEHSSASAAEGAALAGGRVTNFTAGQGLVLMKEVLYVIAGKRLPVVFHIGARALTSQGLNVHAGHDDVMSVADCGWGILFARNAQEAGDMALMTNCAALFLIRPHCHASITPAPKIQPTPMMPASTPPTGVKAAPSFWLMRVSMFTLSSFVWYQVKFVRLSCLTFEADPR